MKKILLIIIISVLLYSFSGNEQFKAAWNHFWCLPEENPQQPNQTFQGQEYKTTTVTYKNPPLSIEDELVKYKLQKKPFSDYSGDIPYEFVLR